MTYKDVKRIAASWMAVTLLIPSAGCGKRSKSKTDEKADLYSS